MTRRQALGAIGTAGVLSAFPTIVSSTVFGKNVPSGRITLAMIGMGRQARMVGYALHAERAARLKPGAVVLHPGPINRGVELDTLVADGDRSVVLRQVRNGVFVRMAALAACMATLPA